MQPCIGCGNRGGCCWNCCPNAVKANAYDQLRDSLDKPEELAFRLWIYDAPKADPDEWNKFTPRLKYPYILQAQYVQRFLRGEG